MRHNLSRGQFMAAGAGLASLALPSRARATQFAQRYELACEMNSSFAFLVDPPTNNLVPHPSIADRVRAGTLRQRLRMEFPYFGDVLRNLAYYEDPAKPLSAANVVPAGDPRILIEIFTDVTSVLVKKDPLLHFVMTGLIVGNPSSTFFGDLTSRMMVLSAAFDPADSTRMRMAVSGTASSHVLGAQTGVGVLKIKEGDLV